MPRHKPTESTRVAGPVPAGEPAFYPQEDFPRGVLSGDLLQYNAETEEWERVAKDDILGDAGLPIVATPNDGEVHLTPKASSSGAEGTMFYNDADDHVYVATE